MNQLTHQEQKIVALVAQGLTNKEIAQRLGPLCLYGTEPDESNHAEAGAEEPGSGGFLSGQQANIRAEPVEVGTSYSLSNGISLG
jgi:hypothetical protein